MTPQEALNWCEQFTDNLVMANVDTKRRTLGLQAIQTCKSALEKQIPKKPISTPDHHKHFCPTCHQPIKLGKKYCGSCGQKIGLGGIVSDRYFY